MGRNEEAFFGFEDLAGISRSTVSRLYIPATAPFHRSTLDILDHVETFAFFNRYIYFSPNHPVRLLGPTHTPPSIHPSNQPIPIYLPIYIPHTRDDEIKQLYQHQPVTDGRTGYGFICAWDR